MDLHWLVTQAWAMTKANRFLWWLGLLAGSAGGTCTYYGSGSFDSSAFDGSGGFSGRAPNSRTLTPEDWQEVGRVLGQAIGDYLPFIVAGVAVLLVMMLLFAIFSWLAQGAMAYGTHELAHGRPVSGGSAWAVGRRLFWRYAGLGLLLSLFALTAGAIGVVTVMTAFSAFFSDPPGRPATSLPALGAVNAVVAIAGIVLSIITPFAQRAIAVQDLGVIEALRAGARLFRAHVGQSLLVWLVAVAVAAGVGFAFAFALIFAFIGVGGIGFALWLLLQSQLVLVLYVVVAAFAGVGAMIVASGVINAFFWAYWTLAYVRFTEAPAAPDTGAAAPPVSPPPTPPPYPGPAAPPAPDAARTPPPDPGPLPTSG